MNSVLELVIFIMQVLTVIILFYCLYRLFRFHKKTIYEKRFGPFSVELLEDDTEPLFDVIVDSYLNMRNKLSKFLIRTKIFDSYSKKYEKYSKEAKVTLLDDMNYISNKIFIGLGCVILLLFSCMFKYKDISLLFIFTVFLIGFFVLDIYLIVMDKIRKISIEKDMNKAVIIMNNAFKSGYSIMQAIELVATELDGAISEEFRKMYMDITFGLTMDVVFNRFAERVDCVEARYMATSLTVVNKTGGNITQVFNAVERNAFARKKLKDELASVSASAKAMFKILIVVPIFIVGLLLLLNPNYFLPLFKTPLGWLCLIASILLYVIYIFIIRKIVYLEVNL